MPRPKRFVPGGFCYHVLSRGNARQRVFHKAGDYEAFIGLFDEAQEHVSMRVLAYCLLPNHFHLVLWPAQDGDLSRWMQWVLTTHVRRYHQHFHGSGHVWQGRFKAFPIQQDEHLLAVLRYVKRNPLRANLTASAASWPWSSLGREKGVPPPSWLVAGPVPRGRNWPAHVERPQSEQELAALRRSVNRGAPFGSEAWSRRTVAVLGLEATIRPRGRPRKAKQ
jgi:REP-associated tyrosine transposase